MDKKAGWMTEEGEELMHLNCAPLRARCPQAGRDQWAGLLRGTTRDTTGFTQVSGIAEQFGVPREIPAAKGLQWMMRHHLGHDGSSWLAHGVKPSRDRFH